MGIKTHTVEVKGKNPMVVLDLKHYNTLLSDIEDLEDRVAILERIDEPGISQEDVENAFVKKFGK